MVEIPATHRFIEKDIVAEMLGERPADHDVFEFLTTQTQPFQVMSMHKPAWEGHEPVIGYNFRPTEDGVNFVRFGNNLHYQDDKFDEPIFRGVFKVDRSNDRILFLPYSTLEVRDGYLSWGLQVQYEGTMLDILEHFSLHEYPIVQVTNLWNSPLITLGGDYDSIRPNNDELMRGVSAFQRLTGLASWESYQVEGERTIEQLLAGEFLEPRPIPLDGTFQQALVEGWGKAIKVE